jgi:hypothetical protein
MGTSPQYRQFPSRNIRAALIFATVSDEMLAASEVLMRTSAVVASLGPAATSSVSGLAGEAARLTSSRTRQTFICIRGRKPEIGELVVLDWQ